MRINQYVAAATALSRRAADTAIRDGRVTIGDHPAALGEQVPGDAAVCLDGQPITPAKTHTYLMLNKPTGYVSSRTRQGQDPTLYDLLPGQYHHLRIAGRLDRDSSGLVLLADDGPFIHELTHPSFGKLKTYELTLGRPLAAGEKVKLATGVMLEDGLSQVTITHAAGRNVIVTLGEGRNRQLRRTFGTLGYTIERLHRVSMGPYALGDLASGAHREVTAQ